MIVLLVLVLGSAFVIVSNSQEDYCAIEKEACGTYSHIRCNINVDTTDKYYPGRLLTHNEKEYIVNAFNEHRTKYKKLAIEWNNEFEYIAKAILFVSKEIPYCYATKQYRKVFAIDYQIIHILERNIKKWMECLSDTNARVLRVTEATQIGCIIYSADRNEHKNPFLHTNNRMFCILSGELHDVNGDIKDMYNYNTCIEGKRDKIDLPVDYPVYSLLMVKITIWVLLIVVCYLIGLIGTLSYMFIKTRDLILNQNN